jgi:hypothetical protein
MDAQRFWRWPLAAAVLTATACGDRDGLGVHGCPTDLGGGWLLYGLEMEHSEPRQCPVFLTQPQTLITGATFVDGGISRDATDASGYVKSGAGDIVGSKTVIFGADDSGAWIAPVYMSYLAGSGGGLAPDVASFELYQQSLLLAYADMRIIYSDAVQASLSGPAYTLTSQTYTWSANVTQGVPPFTYRWYRDWELISTASSISTTGADMHLRLDVIDSRGHGVSDVMRVISSECTGSELVC